MEQEYITNNEYDYLKENLEFDYEGFIIKNLLFKHIQNTDIKRLKKTFKITKVKKLGGYVFEVDFKTRKKYGKIKYPNKIS